MAALPRSPGKLSDRTTFVQPKAAVQKPHPQTRAAPAAVLRPRAGKSCDVAGGFGRARCGGYLTESARATSETMKGRPRAGLRVKAIEGRTLHRFTGKSGKVFRQTASRRDVQMKCTHCTLPHKKANTACWASVPTGVAPAVLTASLGQLFDIDTGAYIGEFKYKVTKAWPQSRWTQGVLTVT